MNPSVQLSPRKMRYWVSMEMPVQTLKFNAHLEVYPLEHKRLGVSSRMEMPGGLVTEFMVLDKSTLRPIFREVNQAESFFRLQYKADSILGLARLHAEETRFEATTGGTFLFDGMAEGLCYAVMDFATLPSEVARFDLHHRRMETYRLQHTRISFDDPGPYLGVEVYRLSFTKDGEETMPSTVYYIEKASRDLIRMEAYYPALGRVKLTQTLTDRG